MRAAWRIAVGQSDGWTRTPATARAVPRGRRSGAATPRNRTRGRVRTMRRRLTEGGSRPIRARQWLRTTLAPPVADEAVTRSTDHRRGRAGPSGPLRRSKRTDDERGPDPEAPTIAVAERG